MQTIIVKTHNEDFLKYLKQNLKGYNILDFDNVAIKKPRYIVNCIIIDVIKLKFSEKVLKEASILKVNYNAKLIIVAANFSSFLENHYKTYLYDYYFVVERDWQEITNVIKECEIFDIDLENKRKNDEAKRSAIDHVLREAGIPANLSGFRYLRYAVELLLEDEGYLKQMTKVLYPKIATYFSSTPIRVERAMRNATLAAYDAQAKIFLNEGLKDKKISNSVFLSYIIDVVRAELTTSGSSRFLL